MPRVMEDNAAPSRALTAQAESFRKPRRHVAPAGIEWTSAQDRKATFATMDVALYSAERGALLLVPACMHPPQVALSLYGPLAWCADAHLDTFVDKGLRARIEGEIDLHAYALVSLAEARRVLGPRHPCFDKRPQSPFTGMPDPHGGSAFN